VYPQGNAKVLALRICPVQGFLKSKAQPGNYLGEHLIMSKTTSRKKTAKTSRGRKLRLGIAGMGMGLHHAMAACNLSNVNLVALADIDPKIIKTKKKKIVEKSSLKCFKWLDALPLYNDYKTMICEADIDALLIALPTDMHVSASTYTLKKGLHVLCEKPPSIKAPEMARVAKLSRKLKLTYMYVRQQRFEPAKQVVRKMVAKGQFGKIYHAESKWLRSGGIPFRHGWGVNKDSGGGVLLDLGVHVIDDGWFLMGCPRPIEVMAAMHCSFARLGDSQKLSMPYNADDGCMGTIMFDNGASLQFATTFAMNTAGIPQVRKKDSNNVGWTELAVYGDKAGAEIHHNMLIKRKGKTEDTIVKPIGAKIAQNMDNLTTELKHFADCILKGKEVQNTPEQAVMLMQMLDAARRSAQSGKSVRVPKLT
jgi:predicted dehydrogenase